MNPGPVLRSAKSIILQKKRIPTDATLKGNRHRLKKGRSSSPEVFDAIHFAEGVQKLKEAPQMAENILIWTVVEHHGSISTGKTEALGKVAEEMLNIVVEGGDMQEAQSEMSSEDLVISCAVTATSSNSWLHTNMATCICPTSPLSRDFNPTLDQICPLSDMERFITKRFKSLESCSFSSHAAASCCSSPKP